jgi:clan AA aspartic protease (TIGR02281 family)
MKSVAKKLLTIFSSFFLIAAFAEAEVYQWSDEEGHVHFTDNNLFIPRKYRSSAIKRALPSRAGKGENGEPPVDEAGISFKREGEFILVRGTLNEKLPVTFVVDTGATLTQITSQDASRLGIDVERLSTVGVWLADGSHARVPVVTLSSVSLGRVEVRAVRAVVTRSDVRLLGLNFLEHFKVTVDTQSRRLILEPLGLHSLKTPEEMTEWPTRSEAEIGETGQLARARRTPGPDSMGEVPGSGR